MGLAHGSKGSLHPANQKKKKKKEACIQSWIMDMTIFLTGWISTTIAILLSLFSIKASVSPGD